ncbi:aryl hydrocarbon receptor nuclear translocator homolog isoform X2 [Xenia sp. Carnegie-2017]|uniref:aryl hydrocarbon receptor nuclear translocator homolog isoform X2 n=1 Tax=Xenia sp. Carnegie-2017 TaxID=2897299 RepID=UPI001F038179|nr:aryl hydrocarbon receptor nuclear translocator homolog isoform X2 [Xenia sp. Carnegie-2017]
MAESVTAADASAVTTTKSGRVVTKRKQELVVKEEYSDGEDDRQIASHVVTGKKSKSDDPESSREKFARENHSEIERRRRNKMNSYINELSEMVPTCNENPKKPDKLTVLRMAVDHIKHLREPSYQPQGTNTKTSSFLSERELKLLVLEAAGGFLFVVNCITGRLLYVSDSITPVLRQAQSDWENKSIYQLIHPDDKKKVQDQLCVDPADSGRILDLKTGSVRKEAGPDASRLYTSSRRNFICRMKKGHYEESSALNVNTGVDEDYAIIHCTGFLRSCTDGHVGNLVPITEGSDRTTFCVVAIGRLQPTCSPVGNDVPSQKQVTEFISRIAIDGKFTFLDQNVQDVLGYLPKDLLGKSCYDFVHKDDKETMMESYDRVVKTKGQQNLSVDIRFLNKNGNYVKLRTLCCSFQNPFTDEAEYIVCKNMIARNSQMETEYHNPNNGWFSSQANSVSTDRNFPPNPLFFDARSPALTKRYPELPQQVYMGSNPIQSFPLVNIPVQEDRSGQVRIPNMEANNYDFEVQKMEMLPKEKAVGNRFSSPNATAYDKPQFVPEERRLIQNSIHFPSTQSSEEFSSEIVPTGSYLNGNVAVNIFDRQLDDKAPLQHMSMFDGQISSANTMMGLNPSLIASSMAGNHVYPGYTNCHI